MEVRVRYAPSPTGYQHIGGVRTALFNYLFAKSQNGKFILRLEDTDRTRFSEEYVQNLYDTCSWLGLDWDEGGDKGGEYGPYVQSERFDLYKKYAMELVEKGQAYYCFCDEERLERIRKIQTMNKMAPGYDRNCRNLSKEEIEENLAAGKPYVIRLKVPLEGTTKFHDALLGDIEWKNEDVNPDPVLLKTDGFPTYHLANIVDDHFMHITHVMRAQEWIPSTPLHVIMYKAFGWEHPEYCHLPMVMGQDGQKLSKRHGATAVSEFVEKGYLTNALVNFVALLGWSPSDGKEIKTIEEIAADFRINEVSSSNSIFEYDKLNWMNSHYIKMLSIPELKERLKPYLTKYNLSELTDAQYTRMVEVTYEPLTLLSDITDAVPYFFGEGVEIDEKAKETIDSEVSQDVLKTFAQQAKDWEWTEENLHEKLEQFRAYYKEKGIKPKVTMWAIRAAVTGRLCGADMTAILAIIGKDKTFNRINSAIKQTV